MSLKSFLYRTVGCCVRQIPISRLVRSFYQRRVNILYYHAIWDGETKSRSLCSGREIDLFDCDIQNLKKHFDVVSLGHVLQCKESALKSSKPSLSITFDDGINFLKNGINDCLKRHNIPATMFITSACVGNKSLMWQHALTVIEKLRGEDLFVQEFNKFGERAGLGGIISSPGERPAATYSWPMHRKEEFVAEIWKACDLPPMQEFLDENKPYFTWQELDDWMRDGHTIGFHTMTHPFCSRLSQQEINREIIDPAAALKERLELASLPFSYPFGDRLPKNKEEAILNEFSCLLGIGRLSPRGTPVHCLDRAPADGGLDDQLFGRPMIRAVFGRN